MPAVVVILKPWPRYAMGLGIAATNTSLRATACSQWENVWSSWQLVCCARALYDYDSDETEVKTEASRLVEENLNILFLSKAKLSSGE